VKKSKPAAPVVDGAPSAPLLLQLQRHPDAPARVQLDNAAGRFVAQGLRLTAVPGLAMPALVQVSLRRHEPRRIALERALRSLPLTPGQAAVCRALVDGQPQARIAQAVAAFRQQAPQVTLHMHVGTIAMIERGVIDGQYHLGIIPEHRRSDSLAYDALFNETMYLYAGQGHPWFGDATARHGWADLRRQDLAALGYHSPNMALTHQRRLERAAIASDQEAVATLVLSGAYVGFLPDHYAQAFVDAGRMRAVAPRTLFYRCSFAGICRRAPAPLRVADTFRQALLQAHR